MMPSPKQPHAAQWVPGPACAVWTLPALLLLLSLFPSRISATTTITAAASSTSSSSSSTSILKTKNYIDTISGYKELSSCAEDVLSTVVRGEYSGCGDTYALTSYTCFCTDSSSYMSAVISRDVISSCDSDVASAQASSAGTVFDAYCQLGVDAGLEAVITDGSDPDPTASSSSTATPAVTVYVTSTPTSGSTSSSLPRSTTNAIVIGVVVSVGGILVLVAAWFLWRRQRKLVRDARAWREASATGGYGSNKSYVHPTTAGSEGPPVEVAAREVAAVEAPGHTGPVEIGTSDHLYHPVDGNGRGAQFTERT